MSAYLKNITVILLCGLLTSCGFFDSRREWKGGHYILIWIDIPEDVTLSYDLGKNSSAVRVGERVFAVGWDGRYVVAQQHPKGNKSITNYFFIDSQKDSAHAGPKEVVVGPLSEAEFKKKAEELKLPPFTRVLESLK